MFNRSERETAGNLLARFVAPGRHGAGNIVVTARASSGACVGGAIFSYLAGVNAGYVSYLFVHPQWRRQGIGAKLLRRVHIVLDAEARAMHCGRVRGVFVEIRRGERRQRSHDARVRFWTRAGVFPLAMRWRYPPLRPDAPPVPTDLAFGSYDGDTSWRRCDLEQATRAIFAATYDYLPEAAMTKRSIIAALRRGFRRRPVPFRRI